jgi:hypothetical protein
MDKLKLTGQNLDQVYNYRWGPQLLLKSIAKYCLVLPSIAKYCQVLPSIAKYCQVSPSIAK